ncbi:MAG: ATP-binding cassette domain-containing protein [Leucobacter sp.]
MRRPGLIWLAAVAAALLGALAPTPWWQLAIIALAIAVCALAGRLRARALRWGLWGALLFVALRVVYRIVFSSTVAPPVGATLILDLPVIPLPGPFRGIALLGPFTLEQLLATLAEASRFAVVFVVFGAANALADARTLLARTPRPILPVATVLALALGTVPALLAAAQRVSWAARLRGERRSPRLLVPVFEQAVERAGTLGASMELRGYGSALQALRPGAPGSVAGSPGSPGSLGSLAEPAHAPPAPRPATAQIAAQILGAEGLSLRYDGPGGDTVLAAAGIELCAGELAVVTGPTGGGKSSLLALLAGLAPAYTGGEVTGTVSIAGLAVPAAELRPARMAGTVALLPQRVEHSFLSETVRAELAFAPARRGLSGAVLAEEVEEALERFRLVPLAERDPVSLSAGEATRVALAAACLVHPRVLLLDEPIADLDPDSAAVLLDSLRSLLAEGCAALVAEHRPEPLRALIGKVPIRWFEMREGRLAESAGEPGAPAREARAEAVSATVPGAESVSGAEPTSGAGSGSPRIRLRADAPEGIELMRDRVIERGGLAVLSVPRLSVTPGSVTVLTGPNGSGKTSLLEGIALPVGSSVRAPGIALVPHRVDDLLIRDTVAEECRFADRRAAASPGSTARRFEALVAGSIPREVRAELPERHPRDLSAGTRLALGIAVQLAHAPRVLLLDEPTRGLDAQARRRLAALIAGLTEDGTAVLLATHDAAFSELLNAAGARIHRLGIVEGELR